ncbi:MAG TPA: hypothetical protein VN812_16360, partial [Candidatus Acidoferrales bacterium]|nr:hypothetical protein [Candidatus Acidoferrales bacterium]
MAALQELDRQLREKTERLRTWEAEITELEDQLRRQQEATRSAQTERDSVMARQRELEANLETEEAKMKDRR